MLLSAASIRKAGVVEIIPATVVSYGLVDLITLSLLIGSITTTSPVVTPGSAGISSARSFNAQSPVLSSAQFIPELTTIAIGVVLLNLYPIEYF